MAQWRVTVFLVLDVSSVDTQHISSTPILGLCHGVFTDQFIFRLILGHFFPTSYTFSGAPNGSVPLNICSSGTFLLAGRCGRNSSLWKESVAGKKIIQGVRGDLKSRIAATGYLYGLLTTQDLNCAL